MANKSLQLALDLHALGYNVIPIQTATPGDDLTGKRPATDTWSMWCTQRQTAAEVEREFNRHPEFTNIGIVLGPATRVYCIDCDTADESITRQYPSSPVFKRSGFGRTARFFKCDTPIGKNGWHPTMKPSRRDKAKLVMVNQIEFLGNGQYVVVWGSHHSGKMIEYPGQSLFTMATNDLPPLPDWFIQVALRKDGQSGFSSGGRNCHMTAMVAAMWSRGESKETAIREITQYANESGYDFSKECGRGITPDRWVASSWKRLEAKKFPRSSHSNVVNFLIDTERRQVQVPVPPEGSAMRSVFDHACEFMPPHMALPVTLAFCSSITQHAYTGHGTTLYGTSLYILLFADSGVGKQAPSEYLKRNLALFSIDVEDNPNAGSTLLWLMSQRAGAITIHAEECLSLYSSITGAENHQVDFSDIMKKAFSNEVSSVSGKCIKSDLTMPRTVRFPHITLFGTTVRSNFSLICTDTTQKDGLMGRTIFFEALKTPTRPYAELTDERHEAVMLLPGSVFTRIKESKFVKSEITVESANALTGIDSVDTDKKALVRTMYPIRTDEGARVVLSEYNIDCRDRDENPYMAPFLMRAGEIAFKIAGICAAVDGRDVIDQSCAEFGVSVMRHSMAYVRTRITTNVEMEKASEFVQSINRLFVESKIEIGSGIRLSAIKTKLNGGRYLAAFNEAIEFLTTGEGRMYESREIGKRSINIVRIK